MNWLKENWFKIGVLAMVLAIIAFTHYEILLEHDMRLKLFCETKYAKDEIAAYGPECYEFMKTAF